MRNGRSLDEGCVCFYRQLMNRLGSLVEFNPIFKIVQTRTPNQREAVLLLDRPSRVAEPEAEVEELEQEVEGSEVILKKLMKTTSVGSAVWWTLMYHYEVCFPWLWTTSSTRAFDFQSRAFSPSIRKKSESPWRDGFRMWL